jgi:hypothetical protein
MIRPLVLASSTLSLLASGAFANVVTLQAAKDNTLYFSTAAVSNGAGQMLFSGTNGVGQPLRGLIKFDLAATIPAGSTINSVQLVLVMSQANAHVASNIQLRRVIQDWGESTSVAGMGEGAGGPAAAGDATWNNAFHPSTAWTSAGGAFAATVSATQLVSGNGTYTWASTPAFRADAQSFLDAPATNFGWILFNSNEGITPSAKRFASRQSTNAGARPRLIVDFTPPSVFAPFCFGDASANLCPCGNLGAAGRGCPNSAIASGAQLQATGNSFVAGDTLVLNGTGMPNSTAIFFQGTLQLQAGGGTVFGDGLWCAGGSLVRLAVKTNTGGASSFPGAGDPSVSAAGSVTAPGLRYYQLWYADTAAFCSPDTFNFTNGVGATWN